MRFYEVSVDQNISVDGSFSNSGVIRGFNWHMSSRKSSSDVSGWNKFYLFAVVDNLRLNVGSVVSNISFNVNGTSLDSAFSLNLLGNRGSYIKSVFSFNEYWVKLFGNSVYIRLDDDLLSGWFDESISDISGLSNNSLSDNFRFFNDSVDDNLRFRVYLLYVYVSIVESLFCLFADDC